MKQQSKQRSYRDDWLSPKLDNALPQHIRADQRPIKIHAKRNGIFRPSIVTGTYVVRHHICPY